MGDKRKVIVTAKDGRTCTYDNAILTYNYSDQDIYISSEDYRVFIRKSEIAAVIEIRQKEGE